jgi:TrmH family RNA methyltransferase
MPNLRVVLVEPQEAGNVGAAARVMKNFGFTQLWVAGNHPPLEPVAGWWASGADDVVAGAQLVPSLYHAIRDAHVTVATTSARGRAATITLTPESLGHLFASLRGDQTMALVFGREDSGLTAEELAQCQRIVTIPTNAEFPTMNLAQAVGVLCYELSALHESQVMRDRPMAAIIERMHERVQALLMEVGFLHENNPDRIYDDLRSIAARADLDARETTIVLGMIRQIEWKISTSSSDSADERPSGNPRSSR